MTRARDLAAGTFELATGGVLKLETSDTTVTDGSVLGKIEFKAPDEASGTDANLTAAAIEAVAEGTFAADNNATELVFKTGASAAADAKMTLDSSGNLLVGKTATTLNTTGLNVNGPDGRLEATASGNVSGIFNRTSSDGDIVSFRKDGTTVGSIGTRGNYPTIGSGDTGISFYPPGDVILPETISGGTYRSNAIDFGNSVAPFKDLYLSGGVFLGGTGAANKLDDYEEGTFAPTFTPDTSGSLPLQSNYDTMQYVKIGNWVTLSGFIRAATPSSSVGSSPTVGNFPFTVANLSDAAGRSSGSVSYFDDSAGNWSVLPCYIVESQTQAYVKIDSSTIGANDGFYISLNYQTA